MEAGVRQLRDHLSRYLDLVAEGTEVTVTSHGRAVARLVPFDGTRPLDRLVAAGVVTPARSPKARRERAPVPASGTFSDLVGEERR